MEVEVSAEAKDRKLNRLVAVTVLTLSVFTGFCNIKDGNLVQAMQQAKSDSVDTWGEYQATRTKQHIAETAREQIIVMAAGPNGSAGRVDEAQERLGHQIDKYQREAPLLAAKARSLSAQYDALNVHDDQFDASEALISAAISMAAVAALVESFAVLFGSWLFGAFGIFMGICGFAELAFHPDILSNFLG